MTAPVPRDMLLEVAEAIGARLCRDAIWAGSRCNWLGASMEVVGGSWKIAQRTFGPDLYAGTSGIALFLAQLASQMDERIFRQTALGALEQALSRAATTPGQGGVGFYVGLTGLAYTCSMLATLLDRPDLIARGLDLLRDLPGPAGASEGIDVLTGYAGSVPALLDLSRAHAWPHGLELATHYGKRLVETARRGPFGWSWNTMPVPGQTQQWDLLGFSHGTAGIAWALLELYQATRHAPFRDTAMQALQYERHWFNPREQNWPDFRGLQEGAGSARAEPGYMVAWCHGAAGIGLSRLRAYKILQDTTCRREAEIAIETTRQALEQMMRTGPASFCLCHGLAGNADLLLYASEVLGDNRHLALAEQVGRHDIEQYHMTQVPWPCGVAGAGETPGLFLGLAGVGHFFLRLHDPVAVPPISILLPRAG